MKDGMATDTYSTWDSSFCYAVDIGVVIPFRRSVVCVLNLFHFLDQKELASQRELTISRAAATLGEHLRGATSQCRLHTFDT